MELTDLEKIIAASAGMLAFGVPLGLLVRLWVRAVSSRSWPSASGIVTRSRLKPSKTFFSEYSADVRYSYEVGGERYTGSLIRFGDFLNFSREDAEASVAHHPVGEAVRVHYHPRYPEMAVLEGRVSGVVFMWMIMCLGALGSVLYGVLAE